MYLYRAINKSDEKSINKNKPISCSLKNTNIEEYDNLYTKVNDFNSIKNALDSTLGHINGQTLKTNQSPWVSTTKDLSFVLTEYAIPQNGKYNNSKKRKPVIVIDHKKLYSDPNEIAHMLLEMYKNGDTTHKEFILDLSAPKELNILFNTVFISRNEYNKENNHIIDRKNDNEYLAKTISMSDIVKLINQRKLQNGLSGFCNKASEVLFKGEIKRQDIILILNPLLQDIIYALGTNENIINTIINKQSIIEKCIKEAYETLSTDELELFDKLYSKPTCYYDPALKYKNLTDIITLVPKKDITLIYEELKNMKRQIIKKLLSSMGVTLNNIRLVDDNIYVGIIVNVNTNIKFNLNDLILIQDGLELKNANSYTKKELKKLNIKVS